MRLAMLVSLVVFPLSGHAALKAGDSFRDCPQCPEMVVIPAGEFMMGAERFENEQPVHKVTLKQFAVSKYEISFAEYDYFCEQTDRAKIGDGGWGRGKQPVININWLDTQAYTEWLSEKAGKTYRLPTEAEWEYVSRAGTNTGFWWGNELGKNQANCENCGSQWDNKQTAPVGSFKPNAFGVFDTLGNVYEWTCSQYSKTYDGNELKCAERPESPTFRGGAWNDNLSLLETTRVWAPLITRGDFLGMRVVKELP
jgi:formylglycine-generating enzyme required for sulfatase activity